MKVRSKLGFYLSTAAVVALYGVANAQDTTAPSGGNAATQQQSAVEEIVVVGQRAALKSAIAIKEKSEVILDSISADDAGKLPDNSVTEVLQRVPGVNMARIQTGGSSENFLGEGTNITIRGLDSVVSQLNGQDSFSASNGRSLAWEDIPPELAQGVDVYKSESADLPEGGFGGIINLRTRLPFDFKGFKISGSIDDNYADYADKQHPGGNILVSDRWNTAAGDFGVLANVAYSNLTTKADGVQVSPYFPQVWDPTLNSGGTVRLPYLGDPGATQVYVPQGINFTENTTDRERTGLYLAAQYTPNDEWTFTTTAFRSEYKSDQIAYSMYVDGSAATTLSPTSNTVFGSNGGVLSSNGFTAFNYAAPAASGSGSAVGLGTASGWAYQPLPYDFETSYTTDVYTTTDLSFKGDYQPNDDLNIKFSLQHVLSSSAEDGKYGYDYAFIPGYGLNLSPYGSSNLPVLSLPSTTDDLSNRANYGWLATMDHLTKNQGTENAAYVDATYDISETDFIRSIKAGLKLTERNEDDITNGYNYSELTPPFNSPPYNYLSATPNYSTLVNTSSWFNGQAGLPTAAYFPSLAMLSTNFTTIHQQLGAAGDTTTASPLTPQDADTLKETTETGYVMANFRNDDNFLAPFRGNIGLRVVAYDDSASGYAWTAELQNSALAPITEYIPPTTAGVLVPSAGYAPNVLTFSANKVATAVSGGHSEIDALPSFNLQFQPTKELHIRFAASEGLSRPTFAQLNPYAAVYGTYAGTYVSYFSGNAGNPDLKPETAYQLDSSVEYYFDKGGLVHFAPFYKQIHNYISTESVETPVTLATTISGGATGFAENGVLNSGCTNLTLGASCPQTVEAAIVKPFNESEAATIEGVEVGLQKYADFLPDPFYGLGIDFNYTFIKSAQPGALAYDMLGNKINGLPLTGLSRNTINLAGMYDYGPLSLRLAWNWRDNFLVSTAAYQTSGTYNYINNLPPINGQTAGQQGKVITFALPVFQYAMGTLDGNISYKLSNNVSWVLQGSNLTKETARLYMGTGAQTYNRSWYTADRRYTTAIRVNF